MVDFDRRRGRGRWLFEFMRGVFLKKRMGIGGWSGGFFPPEFERCYGFIL